jgi:hypothetical protein
LPLGEKEEGTASVQRILFCKKQPKDAIFPVKKKVELAIFRAQVKSSQYIVKFEKNSTFCP